MRGVLLFLLSVVGLAILWTSFFVVDETELAIVTRFGAYRRSADHPGLYFKSPIDAVIRMERRILATDTPTAEYLTLDKKRLVANPITRFRVVDALKFYTALGSEAAAKSRLDDIINSELRRELASHDFGRIVGFEREPMMQDVAIATREKTRAFGVEIVDVRSKRADLPASVQESVFGRMRAERARVAKHYRSEGHEEALKIRADTDKEQTVLLAKAYEHSERVRGEGDAESSRTYAAAFNADPEFFAFVRRLSSYETSLDAGTTVVLSTGSELFRHLNAPQ